jgi:hypothetical protein
MTRVEREIANRRSMMKFENHLGVSYLNGLRRSTRAGKSKPKLLDLLIKLTQEISKSTQLPVKIADFGCGEGEILKILRAAFTPDQVELWGFDYSEPLIEEQKKANNDINFVHLDLLTDDLKEYTNYFDLVFTVNTLHEVYSFSSGQSLNTAKARSAIVDVIGKISSTLKPEGDFVLYDGVMSDYGSREYLKIRFKDLESEGKFLKFMSEYHVAETYSERLGNSAYKISPQTFIFFVSKLRFIDSITWELEKEEIYNYFTKDQFVNALATFNVFTNSIDLLSPRQKEWQKCIDILTKYVGFPYEHIIIHGTKSA